MAENDEKKHPEDVPLPWDKDKGEGETGEDRAEGETQPETRAEEAPTQAEPEPAPVAAESRPAPAPAPRRSGGVFGPVIGGMLAAGLGFATAQYIYPEGWSFPLLEDEAAEAPEPGVTLADLQAQLATLDSRLADMPRAQGGGADAEAIRGMLEPGLETLGGAVSSVQADLATVTESVSGLSGSVTDTLAALDERLADMGARLDDLETASMAAVDGAAAGAIDRYRQEIATLREAHEDEIAALTEDYEAQIAALKERTANLEDTAAAASQEAEAEIGAFRSRAEYAQARAAMMRIDAALASGEPFADATGDFGDVPVPEALETVAAAGVVPLADLQDRFPEAARRALDVALAEAAEGGVTDRVNAFLRSQLGVRSLQPREGDDPDAVLSRAEAALRAGNLPATLTELEALSETARAQMSDWIDDATARAEAVEAARTLEQSLNTN